jgi:hypothetical protein
MPEKAAKKGSLATLIPSQQHHQRQHFMTHDTMTSHFLAKKKEIKICNVRLM